MKNRRMVTAKEGYAGSVEHRTEGESGRLR
jgi:hypothetical protein